MKVREYRRKLKEARSCELQHYLSSKRWREKATEWRADAAQHGSVKAQCEIQKELDESKTLNGLFSKVYSDHVDYSIDYLLDFLDPSANHGEECKVSFLESPCAEDK